MLFYLIRYRYNSPINRSNIAEHSFKFEMSWTIATLVVFSRSSFEVRPSMSTFPASEGSLKAYVVAKQWMWKVEYPGGQREINAAASSGRCAIVSCC